MGGNPIRQRAQKAMKEKVKGDLEEQNEKRKTGRTQGGLILHSRRGIGL